jgi:magnesium transporter
VVTASEAERSTQAESPLELTDELIRAIRDAIDVGDAVAAAQLAAKLHVADQADLLEQLGSEQRQSLVAELRDAFDPELLTYIDETVRADLLEVLSAEEVGAALAQLDTDDAIEVLEDLDEEEQATFLKALPAPDRVAVEQGLTYPEDSAGRMMQRDLVAAPEFWTVGQTIDYLRADRHLPDDFYDIYIVDPRFRPIGSIPLSKILRSKRAVRLTDLTLNELHQVPVELDQEEVGFLFRQYGLVSAPVVDPEGRLAGVITVDDVVHVIEEEAEEDILKLGGVQEADIFAPPVRTGFRRFPWLLVNLLTAVLASLVIAQFEDVIGKVVALAVLMPIVASMGGNAATQTMTVTVRALATKDIDIYNASRIIRREAIVGALNGVFFAVVVGVVAGAWFSNIDLGYVIAAAMIVNMVAAALAGILIPLLLDRFGADPAIASSVFTTTITDVIGFLAFLGLASWWLGLG